MLQHELQSYGPHETVTAVAPVLAGGPGQFGLRHVVSEDVDEHAQNLDHWDQTYDQLDGGRFTGVLTELWLGDMQLFRERTSLGVHESGSPWPGSRTFGVAVSHGADARFCGKPLARDVMMTLGPDGVLDFVAPARFDIIGLSLNASAFAEFSRQTEGVDAEEALRGRRLIPLGAAAMNPLRDFLLELFTLLETGAVPLATVEVQRGLRLAVLEKLCTALDGGAQEPTETLTARVRRQVVARAKDYALAHREVPVTVAELCAELRVSRRNLQYCFQEILGTNPHQYLRALRLNGLHRTLRHAEPAPATVCEAAARWGFWHLSSCAADYRKMFGERPSETLRLRRC